MSDPANGLPLCIMNGTYATALRTAAAGAVAAKYLARPDSRRIGLVGCGVQAKYQLLALAELFDLEHASAWGLNGEARRFMQDPALKKIRLDASDSIQQCVAGADIVVTTTPSRQPLIKWEWLKPDVHINAIGADAKGKQELDPEILRHARVVVDSWDQAAHSGEINVPVSQGRISRAGIYADIGQIVAGAKPARTSDTGITVFDSTGLALQDTAIANVIYAKAKRRQIGRYMNFMQ